MDQREIDVVLILGVMTLSFIAYFFFPRNEKINSWITGSFVKQKESIQVLFQRFCGFVFLGIFPLLVVQAISGNDLRTYGYNLENLYKSLFWTATISAIIIILNVFFSRKPANLEMYPEIRAKEWDIRLLLANTITWIAYLIAYESLFRGLLLFTFDKWFGPAIAIAINVSIYSLVHIHKGAREAVGAIPYGILICWITLQTGSIWAAVGIHIVMALSNEYLSLYFHPEISLKK